MTFMCWLPKQMQGLNKRPILSMNFKIGPRVGRLKTTIYIKPLASSADDSVAVAILGPPRAEVPARSIPAAKGSQWASDRCGIACELRLPERTCFVQ